MIFKEDLNRVANLCTAFQKAIDGSLDKKEGRFEEIMAIMPEDEMDAWASDIGDLESSKLRYKAFGGEPEEDFLRLNITVADKYADVFSRILSEEKVAFYIPGELRNKENVKILSEVGAKKLVKLCKIK